jgi:hypothetical protein
MRVAELSPISRKVKEIYHQYMYVCYPTGTGGEEGGGSGGRGKEREREQPTNLQSIRFCHLS